jgi:hypothetical protein
MKLTLRSIADIKPDPQRDVYVWDEELAGFGLRIKPSGTKSFMLQYRNIKGDSRRITLGKLGALTPDEARKEARKKLADVASGWETHPAWGCRSRLAASSVGRIHQKVPVLEERLPGTPTGDLVSGEPDHPWNLHGQKPTETDSNRWKPME